MSVLCLHLWRQNTLICMCMFISIGPTFEYRITSEMYVHIFLCCLHIFRSYDWKVIVPILVIQRLNSHCLCQKQNSGPMLNLFVIVGNRIIHLCILAAAVSVIAHFGPKKVSDLWLKGRVWKKMETATLCRFAHNPIHINLKRKAQILSTFPGHLQCGK